MLKTEWLYYLNRVYKFNSIKYAAEAIPCSPSTISAALHKLEEAVGLPLLRRTYRGVELTETAQEIAKKSDNLFKRLEDINEYIERQKGAFDVPEEQDVASGNHKLTMYLNSGFYQGNAADIYEMMLCQFNIELNLLESDWRMERILQGVNDDADTVSLGFFKEPIQEESLAGQYPNVRLIKLKTGRPSIYCHRDFFEGKTEVTPKEVLTLPFLRYTSGYEQAMQVFEILEEYGKVNIVGNYSNVNILSKALLNKKGISVGINVFIPSLTNQLQEKQSKNQELHYIPLRSDVRMTLLICYNKNIRPYCLAVLKRFNYLF